MYKDDNTIVVSFTYVVEGTIVLSRLLLASKSDNNVIVPSSITYMYIVALITY